MLSFTPEDQRFLKDVAHRSLKDAFAKVTHLDLPTSEQNFVEAYPCFVTLLKGSRLRGCIGCMETNTPLIENIYYFARQAAFHDPRFSPVQESELPEILVEISVLGPTQPLPQLDSLVIGKHGLEVSHGYQRGVLLAKVASQYRWSREEFLKQTCIKAGLNPENAVEYKIGYFEEYSF